LGKVQSTYASIETLHGGFRQDSYVAALDEQESSSGEMWFGKPGKMRWVYAKPRPQTVVINGGTLWLYQPENRQVVIDDIGNVLLSSLPVSFMMGLGNLSRDFDLKGACKGSEGVVLQLVPRKKEEKEGQGDSLDGFDLLVDAEQALPKGAKISSLGGNTTEIVFSNLSTKGGSQPAGRFVLEYPKGVDVMDRRLSH
jgi:outer membrane lipoprotein carrier protein